MERSDAVRRSTVNELRELGFYYDSDDSAREWRLTGSRAGLARLPALLRQYVANPRNADLSEHDHYGPYMYLKVMTWSEPGMDGRAIYGTLADLARLADIIDAALSTAAAGDIVCIRTEFAADAEYTLVLHVREDGFDPPAAEPGLLEGAG